MKNNTEKNHQIFPEIMLVIPPQWDEYDLLDSGDGMKLEKVGAHILIRPEPEAIWKPVLKVGEWHKAQATYQPGKGEESGHWKYLQPFPARWPMTYRDLRFWIQLSSSRHIGFFPEQAAQWDWIENQVKSSNRNLKVLNLFGYTGIASLAAAHAGAIVTHIDASAKAMHWARENQALSNLEEKPIRWIVDDALKFTQRENRRGMHYDSIILDPPKFGRGPKGEVWEFYRLLPNLLSACAAILSDNPQFILVTAYAVKASALTLHEAVKEIMAKFQGKTEAGELVLKEKSAGRMLSRAIFASWQKS